MVVNSDCKQAIDRIKDVDLCRDIMMRITDSSLEYAPRITNKVADRMARVCRTELIASYNLISYELPPGFVSDVLLEDRPP